MTRKRKVAAWIAGALCACAVVGAVIVTWRAVGRPPAMAPLVFSGPLVSGRVLDEGGRPVEKAHVRMGMLGLADVGHATGGGESITDEAGRFEIRAPFAGKLYYVTVHANGYESVYDGHILLDGPVELNYSLKPGRPKDELSHAWRHAAGPIDPKKTAAIRGRVLTRDGAPVAGAVVATRMSVNSGDDLSSLWRATMTDADGRYVIYSPECRPPAPLWETVKRVALGREKPLPKSLTWVYAFHGQHGDRRITVRGLVMGRVNNVEEIRLPGAARVRGVVVDEAGAPVEGVHVIAGSQVSTGPDGRFDLGMIVLGRHAPPGSVGLILHASRPDGGLNFRFGWRVLVPPEPGRRWFHHQEITFDEEAVLKDLKITLKEAAPLALGGRILDESGKGVAGADVVVYTGAVHEESFLRFLHPADYRAMGPSSFEESPVARAVTDKDGLWSVPLVHDSAEGLRIDDYMGPQNVPFLYSIGAEGPNGDRAFVNDVTTQDGQPMREVELILRKPPQAPVAPSPPVAPVATP